MYTIILVVAMLGSQSTQSSNVSTKLVGNYEDAQTCSSIAAPLNQQWSQGYYYVRQTAQCVYIGKPKKEPK